MGKLKNSHDHVTKIIVTIFILNSRRPTVQMRPNLYAENHDIIHLMKYIIILWQAFYVHLVLKLKELYWFDYFKNYGFVFSHKTFFNKLALPYYWTISLLNIISRKETFHNWDINSKVTFAQCKPCLFLVKGVGVGLH